MRVFGTGVLGTRYRRVPSSWYRAEGRVGSDRLKRQPELRADVVPAAPNEKMPTWI